MTSKVLSPTSRPFSFIVMNYSFSEYRMSLYNARQGTFLDGPKNLLREQALNGLYLEAIKDKERISKILASRPLFGVATGRSGSAFPLTPNCMMTLKALMDLNGEVAKTSIPTI